MAETLTSEQWHKFTEDEEIFDIVVRSPAKGTRTGLYHVMLSDALEIFEQHHWDAVMSAWVKRGQKRPKKRLPSSR